MGSAGLPYDHHFMFYYAAPGLSPQQTAMFFSVLQGSDYDRFIRTEDLARTLEQWLLNYGQAAGSITTSDREDVDGEIAGGGTGGVNQGAE